MHNEQGDFVVINLPDSIHRLTLPLLVLVCGDVSALSAACLSNAKSGQVILENEMKVIIKNLVRHSVGTGFGSFPTGPLKQAIGRIIRLK